MKKHLLKGLPNVIERVRQMREGVAGLSCEAACSAEATSNQEYVKGLSAWNFDVKELRRQVLSRNLAQVSIPCVAAVIDISCRR